MKNIIPIIVGVLVALTSNVVAQTASVSVDNPNLAPGGGGVVLTASVAYDGQPGALGVAVQLPVGWTLVSVAGVNVPAIAPESGSTGTLEFAYTQVPANGVRFSLVVRYPEKAVSASVVPTVLVRSNGKLATLLPAPIAFRGAEAKPDEAAER